MSIGPPAAPSAHLTSAAPTAAVGMATYTPEVKGKGAGVKTFVEVLGEGRPPQKVSPPPAPSGLGRATPAADARAGDAPAGKDRASSKGAAAAVHDDRGLRVMAEQALDAERRVDALIASAGRGRTFSAAELIALQATVFRYSQTVEVISRAADRLVGAIKQTLGTQV